MKSVYMLITKTVICQAIMIMKLRLEKKTKERHVPLSTIFTVAYIIADKPVLKY